MGNANGVGSDYPAMNPNNPPGRVASWDSMANSPPESPGRSRSPLMFNPQLPVAPLPRGGGAFNYNNDVHGAVDQAPEKRIPMLITWSLGGNNVAVEGSWDNWTSRKILQRSGKDHTVLLVLPSGIYHYRFIVDGETRYMPDQPCVSTEMGLVWNVLDVNDCVPESLDSVAEFEPPSSPDSSYSHTFPEEDEFAKDPTIVPAQLHLTVLGTQKPSEPSSSRPQHVVLNHLFMEKGWAASQSMVALGLTHRFQSKYVTVVLYKPLRRI
ncbi:SNF1-related protein kinase regulatory subunit beta-1 isoform X1 [Silene latifolia]|uniref:SNF1-related protein kinase regulatory subunit beta-1 isoform X1 n=2 Tax=Silene latifolia TaxID=37657 RepID=UPI003D7796AC